jgi:hypothetical protein
MDLKKIAINLVLIIGLLAFLRACQKDYEANRHVPLKPLIHFESRVNPAQNGLQVTNNNDFAWPDPTFTINGAYHFKREGAVKGGETVELPFSGFKNEDHAPFRDLSLFHNFDIRTATMYTTGKR